MSDQKENSILSLVNLHIGYFTKKESNTIFKDIDVNLHKGKLACILGKNGIGKSTLLRTITSVQPKIFGEILIQNKPLENYTATELAKKISLVLTEKIPPSNLTVYELIALARQPYTNWLGSLTLKDKDHINFAIEQTKLNNLVKKRCDELSDGQLQRVMICRALAQNTEIIILDEPTAHLDIQHKIETFQLLKYLANKLGKTILISTHEIQLALQMSDTLILMTEEGLINGVPEDLIKNDYINKLFDSKIIHFDKNKNQFIIN